jgi:hypothetical protein
MADGPGTIVHRDLAVLAVSEIAVFDEIRAILPLDDYALAWLSPTEMIIDPARVGELNGRLAERGMAPLMRRETLQRSM